MTRYLLAAEADQIQDLIFRASRLREVVGGSQLLSRFCKEGAVELLKKHGGNPDQDIIINDGGAFRILFEAPDDSQAKNKAEKFGNDLAELYRRVTGGNLTVAEPVPYNGDFRAASQQAQEKLRDAKNRGDVPATAVHLPYLAFCASCGITIAVRRHKRHRDERENYYCDSCLRKEKERDAEVEKLKEESNKGGFLGLFYEAVSSACESEDLTNVPEVPPQDADDIAVFDLTGRRYVAYLLADGNGMGAWFSACLDEQSMKSLSSALPETLRTSLAASCPALFRQIEKKNKKQILPVLPLILGGDDLFALLPAPWAIDFAARFCREYEKQMKEKLSELNLLEGDNVPTITAAVVICKANYPHMLAHRLGEELLEEGKQLARGREAHPDTNKRARVSVLNFALVTGNEVGRPVTEESARYRPAACPYFVTHNIRGGLKDAGISVRWLLQHRFHLSKLPGKRRAEFERLYDDITSVESEDELKEQWRPRWEALLNRIRRTDAQIGDAVEEALKELGEGTKPELAYWKPFDRWPGKGFWGHGFPDLLTIWDYAYDLDKDASEYEE